MSDIKKKLLQEIDSKIKRNKEIRERKASGTVIDDYVVDFIKQIEDLNTMPFGQDAWQTMATLAVNSLENQVKRIDPYSHLEVMWHTPEDEMPQVNGVLVKWSTHHQTLNKCEPELFVDVTSLLFK